MKKNSFIITAAVLSAVVGLGTACTKKPAVVETPEAVTTQASTAKPPVTSEPVTSAEDISEEQTEEKANYHMLQGTVTKVAEEGVVFTLQADDGNSYDIKASDIRDVEAEIQEGVQIAIAYIGQELGELKDVTLVVALPEQEEWSILTDKGTTVSNMMSSFTIKTQDGQELGFLKDNCPVEEGVLGADSGEMVEVIYVNSQGVNYPVDIKAAK